MHVCMHTCVQVLGGLDPLKLKSQAVVNLMLNMELIIFFCLLFYNNIYTGENVLENSEVVVSDKKE